MTDDHTPDAAVGLEAPPTETEAPVTENEEASTQYGVGPFTIRELAILIAWGLAFIVSFFSVSTVRFESVWTSGLLWILTIAVPTVAVFLIVLRRFSPDGIRRVGSLGIDQFASVAFSVSAVLWLQLLWDTIAIVVDGGPWLRSWVVWVELALMIALVVLTVFAPFITPLCDDFQGRPEVVAHRNARPVRKVIARPRPVRAAPEPDAAVPSDQADPSPFAPAAGSEPAASTGETGAYGAGVATGAYAATGGTGAYAATGGTGAYGAAGATGGTGAYGAAGATGAYAATGSPQFSSEDASPVSDESTRTRTFDQQPTQDAAAPSHQAFWALVPEERDVVDERDIPIFRIGPTAWALVIEDRGETFVIRHEDGRIGYLHDVSGVTRG